MSEFCILCKKPVHKYSISKISLHAFPTCPKNRHIWLNQCRLTNADVLPKRKICSFHFEPTCFKTGVKRRILYPNAVPTIFGNDHVKTTNLPLNIAKGKPKNVNKDSIAGQNRQSLNISPTKAANKVLAGNSKNSKSRDTSLTKSLEEENAIQSRIISLMKTLEEQNFSLSRNNSLVKNINKMYSLLNHNQDNLQTVAFEIEYYERAMRYLSKQKKKIDQTDKTIAKVKKQKSSVILQLQILKNNISMYKVAQ